MIVLLLLVVSLGAGEVEVPPASLDHGYRLMYNLDFARAQKEFTRWQEEHQDDPLGPVSEAAGFIFAELNRLEALEAQFFIKDSSFAARRKLSPDSAIRARLDAALQRDDDRARRRLERNPKALYALFSLPVSRGFE